ncbi:MAG TPA: DUF1549 domain-containing protein, partial [Planctomycetota bacterium]|nr:DUF1549 domain-containing protein [Planctomycetota bacterium]
MRRILAGLLLLAGVALPGPAVAGQESPAKPEDLEFFEAKIRPVLAERCYECHSTRAKKLKGGLTLDTREGVLRGGDSGPTLVPGDPEKSLLMKALRGSDEALKMPPRQKLSPDVIADFETWVKRGAPDPRVRAAGAGSGDPNLARRHWAFQPIGNPQPPPVKSLAWVTSPVDRFVLAKLEERGLRPAPPADRRTLLRRVTYDLTGLPPAPEEVDAFLADPAADAFPKVVDRLLASPAYGEHWGRHWLDVARYADTKGYVYGDREEARFVHSYLYRDWVVRAFNEDLPYDQFLIQQIAADQLPLGPDRRALAAMGFLTLGRRFLGVVHDIIDDRIDTLARGTMALTVSCARCHDHKFDPIPTADYYSLYGVFAGSVETTVALKDPSDPSFAAELGKRQKALETVFAKKRDELLGRIRKKTAQYLAAVL